MSHRWCERRRQDLTRQPELCGHSSDEISYQRILFRENPMSISADNIKSILRNIIYNSAINTLVVQTGQC